MNEYSDPRLTAQQRELVAWLGAAVVVIFVASCALLTLAPVAAVANKIYTWIINL